MVTTDPEVEYKVYNKLTRKEPGKWTLNLIICCLTVATGSLQFGYNISSMNSVTKILKDFIHSETFLFNEYNVKSKLFQQNEGYIIGNETKLNNSKLEYEIAKEKFIQSRFSTNLTEIQEVNENRIKKTKEIRDQFNMTVEEYLEFATNKIAEKKQQLESYRPLLADGKKKVDKVTEWIWTIVNCLFVVGGMVGTFSSKFLMDNLGRKTGILVHHMFSIVASVLALAASFYKSPICLMISRFLFGIQGGMSCSLIPTYLSEIAPPALRGRTGVVHQLCITIGILIAQVFGLEQLLGSLHLWSFLLAFPIVPALLGSFILMFFMPESPRALLTKNKDEDSTRAALIFLRKTKDVDLEMEELTAEAKGSGKEDADENITIIGLFKSLDCRWPIITSIVIHVTQQLCGINAIFYYSMSIFEEAGILGENIQYAILSTGVVNLLTTIICVPLIDKLGRKPLLVFPMIFMIIDFACLILLLKFKGDSIILSNLSIVCIMLFIICFAIGLGPIPFIYTAECFRQNARSSAMALSSFTNWSAGLLLTLIFPFLLNLIGPYVFVIFAAVIGLAVLTIISKVPETKGKSIEEIIERFTRNAHL